VSRYLLYIKTLTTVTVHKLHTHTHAQVHTHTHKVQAVVIMNYALKRNL